MRGTLSDQFRGKHPFFWVVVVAGVIGVCSWAFAGTMLYKYLGMARTGYYLDNQFRVTGIYPGGPAEGKLQVGDFILAINGVPITYEVFRQVRQSKPIGTTYRLEIERNGVRQQIELILKLHRSPNLSRDLRRAFSVGLVSLTCLLVAILAGLLRPSDAIVRLFFTAFYFYGQNQLLIVLPSPFFNDTEKLIETILRVFFEDTLAFPILFHFILGFPPGVRKSWFWNIIKWALYTVGIGLQVLSISNFLSASLYNAIWDYFAYIVLIAIILVVIRNYRVTTEPQQRKRIRWIIVSIIVASFIHLLFLVLLSVMSPPVFESLFIISWLLILLVPIAWAYAILKHRVLDISVVIRRSVRYLLTSRGFILIEALLAFALLSFLFAGRLGAWLDRFGSNTRTLIIIVGTVLLVLGLQYINRKVHPLIERRFFRDAYDAQQILTELTSSLRTTTNVRQVQELTAKIIQQALYVSNVTIFLRNGKRDFSSVVSSDYCEREKLSRSVERELHLPDEAFVLQRVHETRQPTEIDWDDPYSPVATQLAAMANGDAAAQQEFDTLRVLKTNLVLPLAAKDGLLGVLALGPRAGDLPYSREDKRMLMNVAGQTAMALENSRLIEQKIELEAQNEQRAKELEEARQLRLSMLPKKVPQLPGLEIAAYMKTATEVGGDYYDFHVADDDTLTIAVGDATGHGLRAGMMVTATKSLFNELVREPDSPELMRRCSRSLKAMNLRGLFMALTIVRINGKRLTITSAGMPAALLYRAAEQRVEELLFKSMPLGSITNYVYKQQEATIAAGDVLVLLSDGLPERFNANGEMLGDDAAVRVLCETTQLSPAEIIQRLVQLGDEWGGARPQDDDATFVVVQMN